MIRLKLFEAFRRESINKLSGIALIVDDNILLVLPEKFKESRVKWSLPKGHIEGKNSLISALKELNEETGILMDRNYDNKFTINYKKSGISKELEVFVYRKTREDLSSYLKPNSLKLKNETITKVKENNEIYKIGFFPLDKAMKRMEIIQRDVINVLSK
jgi:8-oxo-dGTP pyrophosphatase MutT (NUDIX family)